MAKNVATREETWLAGIEQEKDDISTRGTRYWNERTHINDERDIESRGER